MDISEGRYWQKPWSLVSGCTPCSPGCDHCWSAAMAHRFAREGEPCHSRGVLTDEKGRFDGTIITRPDRLDVPLKRRKPTVYAVWNDLFHEDVPSEFIAKAYATMWATIPEWWTISGDVHHGPGHTFLVLTKRADRMLAVLTLGEFWERVKEESGRDMNGFEVPFIWHGLTVCNQEEADEKIPIFLQVPGKKFLSIEPCLGPISLRWITPSREWYLRKLASGSVDEYDGLRELSGVIMGGETGAGARPMHPDWVRSVRDQCAAAGVPFFLKSGIGKKKNYLHDEMKQWGNLESVYQYIEDGNGWPPSFQMHRMLDGNTYDQLPWRNNAV